jgi:glycosyltransferase involved in cell wall biosynthesis
MGDLSVFIGMPVFNGESFVERAIETLRAQTHTNWRLLISDNASTDRTGEICRRWTETDSRITYFRQPTNLGAVANFDYVLSQADGDTFMWASADDEWAPQFLTVCTAQLAQHPDAGFAFTDIVNIDSLGETIRSYPSFSRFFTNSRFLNVYRMIRDYEIMGKANVFYSLYRLDFLRSTWIQLQHIWHHPEAVEAGADMACVLGCLARRPLVITPEVLFRKRWVNEKDGQKQFYNYRGRLKHCLPTPLHHTHCRYLVEACRGTPWLPTARLLTAWRHCCLKIYRALRKKKERRTASSCPQCGTLTSEPLCWTCASYHKSSPADETSQPPGNRA